MTPASRIEVELERLVNAGLWDIEADQIEQLRSLSIFGGVPDEPAPLQIFRPAFRDFLKTNEELEGALSEMARRLYGAERPWREDSRDGRLTAFGEVEWRRKTNTLETTRRPRCKRRTEMRDLLTRAILTAEAGQHAEISSPVDASGAPTDGFADTEDVRQTPQALREPSPQQPRRLRLSRRSLVAAALGLALAAIVVAGFATGLWVEKPGGSTAGRQSAHSQSRGEQATPEPIPNRDASCASLGADAQEHTPSTEFVDSPGQLGGGEPGLVGRIIPNGTYSKLLEVKRGEDLEISITLFDGEYTPVSDVVVAVAAELERPRCARLMAIARSTSYPKDRAELGPLRLKSASISLPRIKYVPGSTVLLTEGGHQLAHLSDGVMGSGTAIPYQIPTGGTAYYVNFEIKVE